MPPNESNKPITGYLGGAEPRARIFEDGNLPPGWSKDPDVLPPEMQNSTAVSILCWAEASQHKPDPFPGPPGDEAKGASHGHKNKK